MYDTDVNSELTEYFEELLEIYTPADMLPLGFPAAELRLLVTELTDRWHIFDNKLTSTDVYNIYSSRLCRKIY